MGWASTFVLGLLVTSCVFLAVLVWAEWVQPHPMLDLRLFRSRVFSLAVASSVLNVGCVYAALFLMPFYLIQARGFSPATAGLLFSAQPLGVVIATPVTGYLYQRLGYRVLATSGTVAVAAGLFALHGLDLQSGPAEMMLPMALIGMGNGLFVTPAAITIMGAAPREAQGVANGMVSTARNLGLVFGVAFAGALFSMQMAAPGPSQSDPGAVFIGAFQGTLLVLAVTAVLTASMTLVSGPASRSKFL
ncbi:MAG: MFS transporter [Dehalococcoidia bacterium]|nr:MFS transporter [Dehalococcoidia bacterium]